MLVYVEGSLSTRNYTDASGVEKSICEVILPRFRGELNVLSRKEDDQDHTSEYHEEQKETDPQDQ